MWSRASHVSVPIIFRLFHHIGVEHESQCYCTVAVATCPASEVRAGSGVSSVYDYSRGTADNYEQKGAAAREFFSPSCLDYTYHTASAWSGRHCKMI